MDDFDALEAMLDAEGAPAWRHELPGDEVRGMVITTGERDGDYGPSPFVTVQVAKLVSGGVEDPSAVGETRTIHGFGLVLAKKMREQMDKGLDYGWVCAVRFVGERNGTRSAYKDFSFVAKAPAGTPVRGPSSRGQMAQRPMVTQPAALDEEEPF